MASQDALVQIVGEELVEQYFGRAIIVHQCSDVGLCLQFKEDGALPFEQTLASGNERVQEQRVKIIKTNVVTFKNARDEGGAIGLAYDFLLRKRKHV